MARLRITVRSGDGTGPVGGTSRMAVRFTIWRGGCSVTAGAPATGRTSTTTASVTRSCQPRRIRPVSITAVQARVATPSPNVGSVATPRIRARWIAGSTPIGVSLPTRTTRSPSAAFPGDVPTMPRTTAKTRGRPAAARPR